MPHRHTENMFESSIWVPSGPVMLTKKLHLLQEMMTRTITQQIPDYYPSSWLNIQCKISHLLRLFKDFYYLKMSI